LYLSDIHILQTSKSHNIQVLDESFSSIVLAYNQVDPAAINYQGLSPSVHPHSYRSGFLVSLTGITF